MPRGAVILIQNNQIALIKRVRKNEEYFLIPGGQVEEGETIEEAAIRETYEELGLHVQLGPLAAVVEFPSRPNRTQYYYWAQITGGEFGTGDGDELKFAPCILKKERSERIIKGTRSGRDRPIAPRSVRPFCSKGRHVLSSQNPNSCQGSKPASCKDGFN